MFPHVASRILLQITAAQEMLGLHNQQKNVDMFIIMSACTQPQTPQCDYVEESASERVNVLIKRDVTSRIPLNGQNIDNKYYVT